MIGIIPAAGRAERMYGLPKFLLPIADSYLLDKLCQRMRRTKGVRRVIFGTLPAHFHILHSVRKGWQYYPYWVETETMNETVLAAHSFTMPSDNEFVLFGMPDTYWTDDNVYQHLIEELNVPCIASVAVWYVLEQYRNKRGMVKLGSDYRIMEVVDKPQDTQYYSAWVLGWGAMAWSSMFWQYILPEDAHVGFALQRAIDAGEKVQGVVMDGQFWDCGTPDEYFDCIRALDTVKA